MPNAAPNVLSAPRCLWNPRALLGEGAVWSPRLQCLWWVDILGRKLHRWQWGSGEQRSWEFDQEISSLAERGERAGLAVTLRRSFALFDPDTSALEELQAPEPDRPGNRFNDGKCDRRGRYWAGTMDFAGEQRTGAVYRLEPVRSCTRHDDGIAIVNGPTWSADDTVMYVASTATREVFAYDFDAAAGTISNRRVWLKFADEDGYPDGMTTDAANRVWIAHWGAGCVTAHDAAGTEILRVRVPARFTTSCAFGGPELSTLFITSACGELDAQQREQEPFAGALFAVDTDVLGLPANPFGG